MQTQRHGPLAGGNTPLRTRGIPENQPMTSPPSLTPVIQSGQPSPENAPAEPAGPSRIDPLPDFLPGRLRLRNARAVDYDELAHFHYRARRPATWARVLAITHQLRRARAGQPPRVVAVGVLSWPTAVSRPRREAFGLAEACYAEQLGFANRHIRTISRVIVHPQFRGLGLARLLIQHLCAGCPTRFVEATASMADAHPMFERAGMRRLIRTDGGPAYFWLDREPGSPPPPIPAGLGGARLVHRGRTAAEEV